MKIYALNSGKKRWVLDAGKIQGKRQRIFFLTKAEAEKEMRERELIVREQGKEGLALAFPKRLEYMAAEERLKAMGTTISKAVDFYEQHSKRLVVMPLETAIGACVESKELSGLRPTYTRMLRKILTKFAGAYARKNCSDISRADVERFIRSRGKVEPSQSHVRNRLINIRTFFNYAVKQRWCMENPGIDIESVKIDKAPPGIHTVEQATALLNCAREHDVALIGYLAPLYFGGLRPIEAEKLRPANIHEGLIEVTPEQSKTRRRRFSAINETLRAWLALPGVEYGCPRLDRRLDAIRARLADGETKFPWPRDVLRHSFCSYGLPKYGAAKIAEWAGHSETILYAHYRERVKPVDVERYWAILP